jgi:uncharacterized membrane protein YwzB
MIGAITFLGVMQQALPFLGASFGIGFLFTVIYYMYAKAMNDKVIESRAKTAVFSVFETMAIFAIIIMFNPLFEVLIQSLAGIPQQTADVSMPHLKLAEVAMNEYYSKSLSLYKSMILSEFAIQFLVQMTSVEIPVTLMSGSPASIAMGYMGIRVSTDEMFGIINGVYNTMIRTCIDVMLMTLMRKSILDLALPAMALIFPLGLFFRGLYITKRTGSSLIALSIVLYFVYPLSITFGSWLAHNFVPVVSYSDIASDPMDPSTYAAAYSPGNLARAHLDSTADSASAMAFNSYISVPESSDLNTAGTDNSGSTVTLGNLASSELYLAPGRWLGTLAAKSFAYSTAGGLINFALTFMSPETMGISIAAQFLVNIVTGLIMLTSIGWFSLVSFAFNSVIAQGVVMMNQLGMLAVTIVLDVLMCVTSYRILADILAGDKSILGLSKVL